MAVPPGGMTSHGGFDLHFSEDERWGAPLHGPVGHVTIFFGKMSTQLFCPFYYYFLAELFLCL